MTTIVISDIHNRTKWIEPGLVKLKELFNYDEVVFLGDYFDYFGDTPFDVGGTAAWLKQSLQRPDRIHLLGNHDMPYMVPHNGAVWCPGYSVAKGKVVRETMEGEWDKLRPAYYTQGFLLSHAGFSGDLVWQPGEDQLTPEQLVEQAEEGLKQVKQGANHKWFAYGSRMGVTSTGGCIWADWDDEFQTADGINQIVGHTPDRHKVRAIIGNLGANYCMDTHNQHIGVIKDGVVEFVLRSQTLGF